MATVDLRVLGSLRLSATDGRDFESLLRQPKRTALLAYLAAATPAGFHRRDTLLGLFWPELDEARARAALNQALYVLRNSLGEQAILTRGDGEVALGEVIGCDARALERALEDGRPADALALYDGELLEGFYLTGAPTFERWVEAERARLRQRASEGAWALATAKASAGDGVAAARWARRAADLAPGDEAVIRRLMAFLHGLGDRAAALRAYEAFTWQLAKDYELEPSVETRQLAARIREGDAAPSPRATVQRDHPPAPTSAEQPRPAEQRRRVRPVVMVALTGVVGLGALGLWLLGSRPGDPAAALPRIAVLPFENLGPADDEHFAAGITDEINARLGRFSGLRVISRTSSILYKDHTKTVRQIGDELHVGVVLEGTIRIERTAAGPREVRVNSHLIRVADDTRLWSEQYAARLVPGEIVRLQSDIAEQVARALNVTLLEPERRSLAAPTTSNLDAYVYYLRGNEYRQQGFAERETRTAVRMFERAVAADAQFARAHAALARAHAQMYFFFYDRSAARLEAMQRSIERALELDPDHPETQLALGYVHYWGHLRHDRALTAFTEAARLQPSNPEAVQAVGNVLRRRGDFARSFEYFQRAVELDPRRPHASHEIANTYALLGDRARAERYYDHVLAIAPEWPQVHWRRARLYLSYGNTRAARAALQLPSTPESDPSVFYHAVLTDIFERNDEAARARLTAADVEAFESQWEYVPVAQLRADVEGRLGQAHVQRAYYDSARIATERRVRARPEEANYRSALALAYAGLGRRDEALTEARKAVELLPVTADALRALYRLEDLARVFVMIGEHDSALAELQRLVALPGGRSIPFLELDPVWSPLRARPEFRKVLRRPA